MSDEYVLRQMAPPQELTLDPKFGSIRLVTPIGRLSYAHLTTPRRVQEGQAEKFSCTVLLNPKACADIWKAICMVANQRWQSEQVPNPQNPTQLVAVNGEQLIRMGRLHSPLRSGEAVYAKSPQKHAIYRGLFALNASSNKDQQPLCFDERGTPVKPDHIYSGCYGRLHVNLYAFPKPGSSLPNRGIAVYLNAVQFARHGERLSGFDASAAATAAFAAAGAIEADPAFGPNMGAPAGMDSTAGLAAPSTVPVAPAGFAAPPGMNQAQQAAPTWQPPGVGGMPFGG